MKKSKKIKSESARKSIIHNSDFIFDTNVILVADKRQAEVSEDCISTCIGWIDKLKSEEIKLVLDDKNLILEEYRKNIHTINAQSISAKFLLWIYQNHYNENNVLLVPITPIKKSENEFKEFPDDPDLKKFEGADKKFIATAMSYYKINKKNSPILEACDTDYIIHQEALKKYVEVKLICEEDIKKLHKRKSSK